MTTSYSPQFFMESGGSPGSSVTKTVTKTANTIREFKHSMTRTAELLNNSIEKVNTESGDKNSFASPKRELRDARESFLKALACSATFVDRFNKFLEYADIDDTWKSKMVDSASKGDYKSFSAYITQLRRFLDQSNQTYQDFVQACVDAEAQCRGIPVILGTSRSSVTAIQGNGITYFIQALFVGAGIVGFGTSKFILGFQTSTSIFLGLVVTIITAAVGGHFGRHTQKASIQYQRYDSIRRSASDVNSSSLEIRKIIGSLSVGGETRLQVQEKVSAASFISALNGLLEEVKKARNIVNPCYEELDKGITVIRVNNF